MKIKLLPPDINASGTEFTIENNQIRFGLAAIKNVGEAAIESILSSRNFRGKFKSLNDFCKRIDLQKVNSKTLESLIKTGAMDLFGKRSSMLATLPKIMENSHREQKRQLAGQTLLFENNEENEPLLEMEELGRSELLAFERELLGLYLTEHPLRPLLSKLIDKISHKIGEVLELSPGTNVAIGGVIVYSKKILTKQNNSEMAFIKVEDLTGSIEVIVFPRVYTQYKELLSLDKVIFVSGKVDFKDDKPMVLADKISLVE